MVAWAVRGEAVERPDRRRRRIGSGPGTSSSEKKTSRPRAGTRRRCRRSSRSPRWSPRACSGLDMFDVQVRGALALADGRIAEMQTGEGKTLAAVPAVVWYARSGDGVHVLTANDYLARRDADWMRGIYAWFGLSVGVDPARDGAAGAPGGVPLRRDLRDGERGGLRLPARPARVVGGRAGPSAVRHRRRRRSRFDPDRRSADSARDRRRRRRRTRPGGPC